MRQALKEKFVGAIIIVTAVVLVLPSILGNPAYEPDFKVPSLPDEPDSFAQFDQIDQAETAEPTSESQHPTQQQIKAHVDDDRVQFGRLEAGEDERTSYSPDDASIAALSERVEKAQEAQVSIGKPLQPLKKDQTLSDNLEKTSGIKPVWAVQVASFSALSNAEALNAQLLLKGYRSFKERIAHGNGDLFRVYVGPDLLRSQAEQTAKTVGERFGVKPLVVRYVP